MSERQRHREREREGGVRDGGEREMGGGRRLGKKKSPHLETPLEPATSRRLPWPKMS